MHIAEYKYPTNRNTSMYIIIVIYHSMFLAPVSCEIRGWTCLIQSAGKNYIYIYILLVLDCKRMDRSTPFDHWLRCPHLLYAWQGRLSQFQILSRSHKHGKLSSWHRKPLFQATYSSRLIQNAKRNDANCDFLNSGFITLSTRRF